MVQSFFENMTNFLSLDFGTKNIGLGIARGPLAEPYRILQGEWQKKANWPMAIAQIQQICRQEGINRLIIGLSEGKMADLTREFAVKLRTQTGLPIDFIDEALSSYEMREKLLAIKHRRRHRLIDDLVAAQLLQNYLDEQKK